MTTLYKLIDTQLHYWGTWEKDAKTAIIHWGIVGQRGEHKEIKSGFFSSFKGSVDKELAEKQKEGYAPFNKKMDLLDIAYKVDGFGTAQDMEKIKRLEARLNQLLAWTGLGHVDGRSSGSGSMEVSCAIVDIDIAKNVIEADLKDTEFSDYSRIYNFDDFTF